MKIVLQKTKYSKCSRATKKCHGTFRWFGSLKGQYATTFLRVFTIDLSYTEKFSEYLIWTRRESTEIKDY